MTPAEKRHLVDDDLKKFSKPLSTVGEKFVLYIFFSSEE